MDSNDFLIVYNDIKNFPNINAVAKKLNCSERTVRRKAKKLKESGIDILNRSIVTSEKQQEDKIFTKIVERVLAETKGNKTEAARKLGMSRSTFSKKLENIEITGFYRPIKKAKKYVITSAQNATKVNDEFFDNLLRYCEYNKAELIIVPFRYKNPTSIWTWKAQADDWWDERLVPYLYDSRSDLGENLVLLADIKVQPTASDPISGFDNLSKDKSCIIGHPKMRFKTVPVPTHETPKIISTTGCVTIKNYVDAKTGKKAEFHHSYSALVVELDNNNNMFHMRQLNSTDDGSFIDLDKEYTNGIVKNADDALCLVMGDVHALFVDECVMEASVGNKNSIASLVNPKYLVWHDVLDFYSANHHHRGNPFVQLAKQKCGYNNVMDELKHTFKLIDKYSKNRINIFPASNHNEAFGRWIKENDWRYDPTNAEVYLETALHMARETFMDFNGASTPSPFKYWAEKLLDSFEDSIFLSSGDGFMIADINVGAHGHIGPNGSRGSIRGFSKLGTKTIVGHSHSPGIFESSYQVGTNSIIPLEYSIGPSSWLHTECLVYANGKRTLIHIIKGKFRP